MKLFYGMLTGLAFFPEENVAEEMNYLQENIPDGFEQLLQYFDITYVFGSYRQIQLSERQDETISPFIIRIDYLKNWN